MKNASKSLISLAAHLDYIYTWTRLKEVDCGQSNYLEYIKCGSLISDTRALSSCRSAPAPAKKPSRSARASVDSSAATCGDSSGGSCSACACACVCGKIGNRLLSKISGVLKKYVNDHLQLRNTSNINVLKLQALQRASDSVSGGIQVVIADQSWKLNCSG
jgi:hypothetical protein